MEYQLSDFRPGQWVKIHPASDWFMRGIRYATVGHVGRKRLHLVWHDGTGAFVDFSLAPRDVQEIL